MPTLQYRGSIVAAAMMVALLSQTAADAQVVAQPGPGRPAGAVVDDVITGVEYDRLNQAAAEKHIQILQEKIRRDSEKGRAAAVDRDARRIDGHRYRIAVDEWLIRMNTLHDPGGYPLRSERVSDAAIADASRPAPAPIYPFLVQAQRSVVTPPAIPIPTPTPITVTIVNADPAADLVFAIGGEARQASGGSRQDLTVAPDSVITFDAGGSLGQARYSLSPGLYEFRKTAEGWALYKMPNTP